MQSINIGAVFVALVLVVPAVSQAEIGFRMNKGSVYTLYQSGTGQLTHMRIHIATFDAELGFEYNHSNCEIVRRMLEKQPGAEAKYWCEKGYYRE